ncbi:hypothetical protein L686_13370 [Stutzerimonas stutzeri MF28]|nr:hypothetical protein L686_13370 [Stutzerimonas stutzeri MF28]
MLRSSGTAFGQYEAGATQDLGMGTSAIANRIRCLSMAMPRVATKRAGHAGRCSANR